MLIISKMCALEIPNRQLECHTMFNQRASNSHENNAQTSPKREIHWKHFSNGPLRITVRTIPVSTSMTILSTAYRSIGLLIDYLTPSMSFLVQLKISKCRRTINYPSIWKQIVFRIVPLTQFQRFKRIQSN